MACAPFAPSRRTRRTHHRIGRRADVVSARADRLHDRWSPHTHPFVGSSPAGKLLWKSRAGLSLRWHDGGAHFSACVYSRSPRDLSHFHNALQGHAKVRAGDWQGTKCRRRHRRLRGSVGRQDSYQRSVDSGRHRRAFLVGNLRPRVR